MTQNQISYWNLKETERSNQATEKETKRANQAREVETNRHNTVVEEETERHNRATELLTSQSNAEQARHNAATEMVAQFNAEEQQRSNLANEQLAAERNQISWSQLDFSYAQLGETIRHNRETEDQNLLAIGETMRSHRENEFLTDQYQTELARHNRASETNDFLNVGTRTVQNNINSAAQRTNEQNSKTERRNKTIRTITGGLGDVLGAAKNGAALLQ